MWPKLLELSFPLVLGSLLTLIATAVTSRAARKHQSKEAAAQREFNAQESRRAEAMVQTKALLEELTQLLRSRRSLYGEKWAESDRIDTEHLEASIRLIPDATTRDALRGLRFSLSIGTNLIPFLPKAYSSPWDVETAALRDAVETLTTYIRGDELPAELVTQQANRNNACRRAEDDWVKDWVTN
ncbi:hypothetical protein [Leucobacter sp. G161]|uniref:hypothetical protein n=1 Tax=Leucobacter sp. G161 TaxID=663704 RepID=UPI00073D0448|nr:hypothetical protein [Leucobacter sp. G161]KUF05674.1 hypothetical protein AUL38_15885 [Leucobacter sp. G161]